MLLFAVPILVRRRLARSAEATRTPSDAPRRSPRSHLGAQPDPVGGWMIWLALMISASGRQSLVLPTAALLSGC